MTYCCLADLYCQDQVRATSTSTTVCERTDSHVDGRIFQPSPLTRQERRDDDLHAFQSPKKKERRIEVIGVSTLSFALLLEFDPNMVAYTERPRVLDTSAGCYELSFWIRDNQGRERFLFIVPTNASRPGQNEQTIHTVVSKGGSLRDSGYDLLFPDVEKLARWPASDASAMSKDYKDVYEARAAALKPEEVA